MVTTTTHKTLRGPRGVVIFYGHHHASPQANRFGRHLEQAKHYPSQVHCQSHPGKGSSGQKCLSQTKNLPFDHAYGTMVIPLGCLPSAQSRPVGSSREGTLAEDKALCRKSFSMAWRPALKCQLSPCVPSVAIFDQQ